jgi:hypothetical protein
VSAFLTFWYWFEHQACTVLEGGYAGISMAGGRQTVFGGSCADGLSYAQQVGGQLLNAAGAVIWPF